MKIEGNEKMVKRWKELPIAEVMFSYFVDEHAKIRFYLPGLVDSYVVRSDETGRFICNVFCRIEKGPLGVERSFSQWGEDGEMFEHNVFRESYLEFHRVKKNMVGSQIEGKYCGECGGYFVFAKEGHPVR